MSATNGQNNYTVGDRQAENWQQGCAIEVEIEDLSDTGDGVGRYEGRVVFVPDAVPGDRLLVRLVRVKPQYASGKLLEVLTRSPNRIRPHCIVADKCGGCQWQSVAYSAQLQAKQNLVTQAIARIGGIESATVEPILPSPSPFGYRNKATYPLSRSAAGMVQAGYYEKNSHRLVNLNQCPVQDPRLNPLLAEVKQDIQDRGWSIYNETEHRGNLRHLALQIGRRTGQILLTLVSANRKVMDIEAQAEEWLSRYPDLVGVCLNYNPNRTNAILGEETRCVAGQPYFLDEFAGVQLQLRSDTFFQVNPETAEVLLEAIASRLDLQGTERLVDAYCGIGTFTLPLAKRVQQAIGLEINPAAIAIAQENAQLNGLTNVSFHEGAVEKLLPQLERLGLPAGEKPDIVLLDPPRKGCDRSVLDTLIQIAPKRIVYISCKPATLARDLKILCDSGIYRLSFLQPADFFPQTSHVEAVAFLVAEG